MFFRMLGTWKKKWKLKSQLKHPSFPKNFFRDFFLFLVSFSNSIFFKQTRTLTFFRQSHIPSLKSHVPSIPRKYFITNIKNFNKRKKGLYKNKKWNKKIKNDGEGWHLIWLSIKMLKAHKRINDKRYTYWVYIICC